MSLSGGGCSWSTWRRTLRMWCQLSRNVQKDPGNKTRPTMATLSSAAGARRSTQRTRVCGSTCYRSTRRSSYREEAKRLRTHPTAMARLGRRNRRKRNLCAGSAIASSRARRGSPGTSANQPLS
ncbi:hypothetical protein TRVL_10079 [Trypanosoma vivax]|nr:hypothetical protein TRVL_10079 [Trypanosoma vivax]